GARPVDRRLPQGRVRAPAAPGAAAGHRGRHGRDAQALRRLQAPHDPGRLRRLPTRAGQGAPRRRRAGAPAGLRAARGAGGPARAGAGMTATATGKRERKKAANREAILVAARRVFSTIGYGAASVRDVVRETDLATGTFYNYFPDKESVLRALVDEITDEARARVHEARMAATTLEGFVSGGFRAYFELLAEDPDTVALMRRNSGTIRAMFDEPALGAGIAAF